MAEYPIRFHSNDGSVIGEYILDLWSGNRDKTNKRAIHIAKTIIAFYIYKDIEAIASLWLLLGNEGESFIRQFEDVQDWTKGAVSVVYLKDGRSRIAAFSLVDELAKSISGTDDPIWQDATKSFDKIF